MTPPTPPAFRLKLPAVRRAVQATPWAILPEKGAAMLELVTMRAAGRRYTAEEIRARIGDQQKPVATKKGAIQVLSLFGVIAHRMDLMTAFSGGTSTLAFADDFDAAMADPNISAIVINTDSPGGSVDGVPELATRIMNARGKGKQIIAVANTTMASAAYWIASAADEVVATPSAMVGSIGVFMVHLDESAADEQAGLTYSLISAGKYKTEGNPYEPLSDEARAAIQASVDEYYGLFVNAVATQRGVSANAVRSGYGEGRVLTAKQALAAGLVDRIDTLDGVLAKLGAKNVSASGQPRYATAPVPQRAAAMIGQPGATRTVLPTGSLAALPVDDGDLGTDPDEGDDEPPAMCPECGAPMDGAECSACDYRADDAPDDAPDDSATASASTTPSSATGRAAADASYPSPDPSRPHEAKEGTMPEYNGSAPGGAAESSVQAAVAAERQRAADIRALGRDHNIPDARVEQLVNDGVSVEQASAAFLGDLKAQRSAAPGIRVGADREAERGFATIGEQLVAIVQAGKPGGRLDRRLLAVNDKAGRMMAASPSGMNESVGSEGGWFVQPELLPMLIEPVYADDPILSRVFRIPSASKGVKYKVVDETSRATGSRWGGIQMYRVSEADTATATKPKLRLMELDKKKLMAVAYLTEELSLDAPAAGALLTQAFQSELRFSLGDEIFRGDGAGQMLGFLKAGCVVSQAIEGGQTIANTNQSIALNTSKMLSHIPAALQSEVIWLYNQELLPYLVTAVVGTGGAAVPVFLGANGISGKPYNSIWGQPAYPSELCEAVGTPGDIVAVVPSQYHMLADDGALQSTSVHVRFLYDENTLKITHRSDGAPVWRTSVTPYKGAAARSPFVTLAARA